MLKRGEMGPVLDVRYSSEGEAGGVLQAGELLLVESRVKVDNQHIEELPLQVIQLL